MTKPVSPLTDPLGDTYIIDAIMDKGVRLPEAVQTAIYHLFVACELGDLVIVQCRRKSDNEHMYVLCAHILNADKISKLMPICELGNVLDIVTSMRPPACLQNHAFVVPAYNSARRVDVVEHPDGNIMLTQHDETTNPIVIPADDNKVH